VLDRFGLASLRLNVGQELGWRRGAVAGDAAGRVHSVVAGRVT